MYNFDDLKFPDGPISKNDRKKVLDDFIFTKIGDSVIVESKNSTWQLEFINIESWKILSHINKIRAYYYRMNEDKVPQSEKSITIENKTIGVLSIHSITDEELFQKMFDRGHENIKSNPDLKTTRNIKDYVNGTIPALRSLLGNEVPIEQQRKRLYVCSECPLLSIINNEPSCGVCSCVLKPDNKSAINLVIREETDMYGCKFPGGSRWKANGC